MRVTKLLRPDGRGLTVVGDDTQAIYAFRGAGGGQLDRLTAAMNAATIELERNCRSTQAILDLHFGPGPIWRQDRGVRHDAPGLPPQVVVHHGTTPLR